MTQAAERLSKSLDDRYIHQRTLLQRFGQEHVFSAWDSLSRVEKERLLTQSETIDWEFVARLHQDLIVDQKVHIHLPPVPWEPAVPLKEIRPVAVEAGLAILRTSQPSYGLLVVAGGKGSGLKFDHPKGLFPGTPLSATPLYQAIVEKSVAAARASGHEHPFPMVFMLSDDTYVETVQYFEKHQYFGVRDRIHLTRQQVLPVLDRRPGHEGRAVMKSPSEIAVGGTGHGDAFDFTLQADHETVQWLQKFGVRYVHFMNVDNLLNPIAEPAFLGEHVLSQQPAVPGCAHISLLLVPKVFTKRMGNVIQFREGEQLRYRSIDYGLYPEVDQACELGHASLQIVTLDSLPGTTPIPIIVAAKEIEVGGEWIPVWKFERSSNNKERYGAVLYREAEDVFASIKKRSEESDQETPATASHLQSEHWKKRLMGAGLAAGQPFALPETTVLELPWEADYLDPLQLHERLESLNFPHALAPDQGYLVTPGFSSLKYISPPTGSHLPRRKGRRWEDQSPDAHRIRAVVAAFNNHFEEEPEVIVRAPGRNTAIGDHQDYPALPQDGSASSRTIAWASYQNVLVAAKRRHDRGIKLLAVNYGQSFTFSLEDLDGLAQEATQRGLHDIYGQEPYPWALSVLALLYSAKQGRQGVRSGLPIQGAEFAFEGNVPMGGGQSSSAAYLVSLTLACNELFGWGIPRQDIYTLADLARSGEHEDYSPFITKGRSGYLDQIVALTAKEGQAVIIQHGDYRSVTYLDLRPIESNGYYNLIIGSGLSRSLAATSYPRRVEELKQLTDLMNELLAALDRDAIPRTNIHQFSRAQWLRIAEELARRSPLLARRAQFIFEEKQRVEQFIQALEKSDISALLQTVNASGHAMSMRGSYEISGKNRGPKNKEPFDALDQLREMVLRRAGPQAAARMIGGGGAGPLYVLLPKSVYDDPHFRRKVAHEWKERTGLHLSFDINPPAPGAAIVWKRSPATLIHKEGLRRIERYAWLGGEMVYRLVDNASGVTVEVVPSRGTVRCMSAVINGMRKSILFNPEIKHCENGAAPYLGPWVNRIKDGRAAFRGQHVNLMSVPGVRDDGDGHALHGLMTRGWTLDPAACGIDDDGIRVVTTIETQDFTEHRDVQRLFGPMRTTLIYRLRGDALHIESIIEHLPDENYPDHRIPVLAAVHPWFLLHPKKQSHAEVALPATRHRLTWKRLMPRLKMIPIPYLPAMPIRSGSRHDFQRGRALGTLPYDDTYTRLKSNSGKHHPSAFLRDWFRDILVEVGVLAGYDEFTLYSPAGDMNTVCLEPQISSINALGSGAPIDARVPSLAARETYRTHMFIRASCLSEREVHPRYAAAHPPAASPEDDVYFPRLIVHGLERGPLLEPRKTATHKDAVRVFFKGRWHIYGSGHELLEGNPIVTSTSRPHRSSVIFHLQAEHIEGPYQELNPPVLTGAFPRGIYEAPSVIAEGDTLHMFAQTTYYRIGGTIEHFASSDGHLFRWVGTAMKSIPHSRQAGIYDVDAVYLERTTGERRPALIYSGFSREGSRWDRPDPCVFLALSKNGWEGEFVNGKEPLLSDFQVPWHNSHDAGNPYYEWGLEGAQLLPLANGQRLLLCVGFEKRPRRDYMPAQRLFFALYDPNLRLRRVSPPILPAFGIWQEYGHGSMMIDPLKPNTLRLLFQARPANEDQAFRDSNTWRLFESIFDISHLR